MQDLFHRFLQMLQISSSQFLRRLSRVRLSSHRAQHMH